MSNVVSPRGPLPPRVYWRRRLLLVVVVAGAAVLVARLVGVGAGDGTEAAAERAKASGAQGRSSQTPTTPQPSAKASGRSASPSRPAARDRQEAARSARAERPSAALSGSAGPLAPPEGSCRPSDVLVVPDVEDTDAFAPVPLRLGLSATGGTPCTFEFGPDSVALQITSGDDLIWQSLSCSSVLEEQSVVVRPGWLTYVTVEWPGRRGSEGCGQANAFAEPGYYWAEAAALGGEPERSQFELDTPPKPEPKKKSEKKSDKRSEKKRTASDDPKRDDGDARGGDGNRQSDEKKRDAGGQAQSGAASGAGEAKPQT